MTKHLLVSFVLYFALLIQAQAMGEVSHNPSEYTPSKVIYDFSDPNPEMLGHMLDRASLLQNIYQNDSFDASIVFVIHEGAIPLFAKDPNKSYPKLMARARSLIQGEIIQFRLCRASAKLQGFNEDNLQDMVMLVPMADAEIVKLQQQGYAYLH